MKTVLIADGNRRLGDLMAELLDDDPRFRVVGVCAAAAAVLQRAEATRPDVVLVSEFLDGALGILTCTALRAVTPQSALLLWSYDVDATQTRQPDVDGILERGMTYDELARAVLHARRAGQVVDLVRAVDDAPEVVPVSRSERSLRRTNV